MAGLKAFVFGEYMAMKRYETPPKTGIYTTCKICGLTKDDADFKWSNGKRVGLVCRECDRNKKNRKYAEDEEFRQRTKMRAESYRNENKDLVREQKRKYRTGNEKLKESKKIYREANRERENLRSSKWYEENKDSEAYKIKKKAYIEANKEKLSDSQRLYYLLNKEKIQYDQKQWRKYNKDRMNHYYRLYGMRKLQRVPAWADLDAIAEIYKKAPDGYDVDHIIPLNGKLVCGLHVENNLQYLPKSENRSKSNKFDPETFQGP